MAAEAGQLPDQGFSRAWLFMSNLTIMIAWAKVLRTFYRQWKPLHDVASAVCLLQLTPAVRLATVTTFVEFFNALAGLTRSNPRHVLLFCVVRAGVEHLVAPHLPACQQWQHLYTVLLWSLGDTIRFGCFALDALIPGARFAKGVRYTVGPLLFPLGAAGEALMVVKLAQHTGRSYLYLAAALWPLGFFPLMKQLLRQRRKFFHPADRQKSIKSV